MSSKCYYCGDDKLCCNILTIAYRTNTSPEVKPSNMTSGILRQRQNISYTRTLCKNCRLVLSHMAANNTPKIKKGK